MDCNSTGKSKTQRYCVVFSQVHWEDTLRDLVATEGGTTVSREDGSLRMHDDITEDSKHGTTRVCGVEYDLARMCEIAKATKEDLEQAIKTLQYADKEE